MNTANQVVKECGLHWIDKVIDHHYQEMYEALRGGWSEINDLELDDELYDDELYEQIDTFFRMSETFKSFNQRLLNAAKSQVHDSDGFDHSASQDTDDLSQLTSWGLLKEKIKAMRDEANCDNTFNEEPTGSKDTPMDVDQMLQAIRERRKLSI